MRAFALYRLPHETMCTLVEQTGGEVAELPSCSALNGRRGFVLAPFIASGEEPILLIQPSRVVHYVLDGDSLCAMKCLFDGDEVPLHRRRTGTSALSDAGDEQTYKADFATFHRELVRGTFRKLVLSRCETVAATARLHPIDLFLQACQSYPRLFVALVYTPQSGLWMAATPEVLLDSAGGGRWHTIALAGTMRLQGADLMGEGEHVRWSVKDIEEQRIVATYIAERLKTVAADISEQGPRTVRAAHLVHLRSDFTFTLLINTRAGDVLHALHPTPAVCGMPEAEAARFIVAHEHTPRSYYSGFMGPMDIEAQTHLYVSLRCMQIRPDSYRLYAGGGLLTGSTAAQEWQETVAKMETMRRLITPKAAETAG